MRYVYILLTTLVLVLTGSSVSAQVSRKGSDSENGIITAVSHYNERNFEAATQVLDKILSADPSNDAAWYWSALVSMNLNDLNRAEAQLKKACELDPSNFWYRFRLAGLYRATSRQELTIDIYEKLLEDFPKKSDLYFVLVELYAAQVEIDKALETLEEIETVAGKSESVAIFRFNLLQQAGRQEEAMDSLE